MLASTFRRLFRKIPMRPIPLYHLCTYATANPYVSTNIHNVTPSNLEIQLSLLKKKFTILSLTELVDDFFARKKSSKRTIAITFDDGYRSVITEAKPIFESYQIPFTFFINGKLLTQRSFWRDKVRLLINLGLVEPFLTQISGQWNITQDKFYKLSKAPHVNSKLFEEQLDNFLLKHRITVPENSIYCSWSELKSNNDQLITYGNHTYSHYVMSSLPSEDQYYEINHNSELIKQHLGHESSIFSIPFGNSGTYNDKTLALIKELGYRGYVLSVPPEECGDFTIDKFGLLQIRRFMPRDQPSII